MHMADALISPATGGIMLTVSGGILGIVSRKLRQTTQKIHLPLIALSGAFILAAQMINYAIPGTGASGHISGALLLSAVIGPMSASICMTTVLLLQSLLFADGGLLALGCNIFNMAILPCMVVYPLLFRPMLSHHLTRKKLWVSSIIAGILSMQLSAFAVVVQTVISHKTALPFGTFALFMQPIHLVIGVIEGMVTATVLLFLQKNKPEVIHDLPKNAPTPMRATKRKLRWVLVAVMLLMAAGIFISSQNPDGLEWSILKVVHAKSQIATTASHVAINKNAFPSTNPLILSILLFMGAGLFILISRFRRKPAPSTQTKS